MGSTSPVGVLDGWLRWPGRCVVVLEAKVDAPLGHKQPERYAHWLTSRDEPRRVLWLLTQSAEELSSVHTAMTIPDGVQVVTTTWTQLASRALDVAPACTEADQLLLVALGRRLRGMGIAQAPTAPLKPEVLALALGALSQVRVLRERLKGWFIGMHWLHPEWACEVRVDDWVDLSVCMRRSLVLANPLIATKPGYITWFVEVFAPTGREGHWPADQATGAGLRVGVYLKGVAVAAAALHRLRAALGLPEEKAHPGFQGAPDDAAPWRHDNGTYHEVWWQVRFDPTDLPWTEERLRSALIEQARRISPLVAGGLDRP